MIYWKRAEKETFTLDCNLAPFMLLKSFIMVAKMSHFSLPHGFILTALQMPKNMLIIEISKPKKDMPVYAILIVSNYLLVIRQWKHWLIYSRLRSTMGYRTLPTEDPWMNLAWFITLKKSFCAFCTVTASTAVQILSTASLSPRQLPHLARWQDAFGGQEEVLAYFWLRGPS